MIDLHFYHGTVLAILMLNCNLLWLLFVWKKKVADCLHLHCLPSLALHHPPKLTVSALRNKACKWDIIVPHTLKYYIRKNLLYNSRRDHFNLHIGNCAWSDELVWDRNPDKSPCINISELTTECYKTDHPERQEETRSTISAFMSLTWNGVSWCVERKRALFKVIAQRQTSLK